ncbi:hypothetical protein KC19_2G124600 [Ceratodon purpureus]|uniref:Protein kinase domain-containing protein n=1 Tax=Ceratodon purpureus TaxID=3225 RepID=A0A8T0IW39_CERPU|nr:hypothetical protein KC19_2G124600 [Ceratodon purpureus]
MEYAHQVVGLWVWAVVVSHLVEHTQGQDPTLQQVFRFQTTDLYGLQQLYAEWNKSTPDLGKNLAGWRQIPNLLEIGPLPEMPCPCYSESWQGVLCLRQLEPVDPGFFYQLYNVWIVGLTLTDSSLTGSLPPAIGNLSSLVSLVITGNKGLKGRLPKELQFLGFNLNILDLQGNGFKGSLPKALSSLQQLQELDLSRNKFGGTLNVDFRKMPWLRTLNLSRNLLGGSINPDYFQDLGQLITLDLSSNNFTGPLFNLTKSPSLNSLNLSFNSFSGEVRASNILNFTNSFNLKVVDLSNNSLTGLLPDFSAWTNLTVLDLSYNQFQAAAFPVWIKNLQRNLQVLRLKGNNLTDQFPNHFLQDFKHLKILDLDNNNMTGTFYIQDVIALPLLRSLSITNNNITDVVYNGSLFKAIERFGINLQGNPICHQILPHDYLKLCVCEQNCIDPEIIQDTSERSFIVIATSVAGSVLAISIFIISLVFWKTKTEKQKLQLQVQQHFAEKDIKPTIFTFNQLRNATEDFAEKNKIGEGSFGIVYKGHLLENTEAVAVKQLFIRNQQSITEFLNEVVVVTAIKHRNLVNLKGCCVREDQRLLVYEYLDNNDLARHLFNQKGKSQLLDWQARLNICLGVARGLHYLHTSAQPRIIHRDIKASNVLLDKDLQPKIADFGLALFFPDEQSRIITSEIAGTRGYWAPEYATLGQLSEKADIYSYGVLLLELVSGRRNLDHSLPEHKVYLCQWGRDLHMQSNVMELVDPALSLSRDEEVAVRRIINIALLCIQVEPDRRPTMAAVVATLEGSLNLEPEGMRQVSQEIEEEILQDAIDLRVFSAQTMGGNMGSSTVSLQAR